MMAEGTSHAFDGRRRARAKAGGVLVFLLSSTVHVAAMGTPKSVDTARDIRRQGCLSSHLIIFICTSRCAFRALTCSLCPSPFLFLQMGRSRTVVELSRHLSPEHNWASKILEL